MPDESRLPPGRTLHLTILDGYPRELFRYGAPVGDGLRHLVAIRGPGTATIRLACFHTACDRCGLEMDNLCYYGWLFGMSEEERLDWDHEELTVKFLDSFTDEEMHRHLVFCAGCRS
jgi:hypothetical protein